MSNKIDIFNDDSLEKDAPLLHSISKENPFSVPENYFESLPSQIIEKCREEMPAGQWAAFSQNLKSYFLNLKLYKWKILTLTGCLGVICFIAVRLNDRPVSYEAMAQNIPDSLIVEHLDNNITTISESTLEDFSVGENNTSNLKSSSDTTSNDQDIIAYLVDNNVSVSEIINEP